ncbi:hypothetical protein VTK26DRAFT_8399 [Humicola hyalothermophila]
MVLLKLAKFYFKPAGAARFAPYILILPIIVLYALSLTGCVSTSPGIPNIYVVSLRANHNASDTPVQVRVGYYGICGIDEDGKRCQSASGRSVETLMTNLFPELGGNGTNSDSNSTADADDVADMINTALDLQGGTFISVLAGAAVLFLGGVVALFFLKRDVSSPTAWDHPRRSAIIRRATYGMLYGSTALVFAASLATTQSAGALKYASEAMRDASVLIKAGTTLQVLQWLVFGFSTLFALAVPFLVRPKPQPQEEYKGEA